MRKYLIWSHEHRQWWGPGHCGYTASIERAGRYTKNEAADIVLDHYPPGEEVAVPETMAADFWEKEEA